MYKEKLKENSSDDGRQWN